MRRLTRIALCILGTERTSRTRHGSRLRERREGSFRDQSARVRSNRSGQLMASSSRWLFPLRWGNGVSVRGGLACSCERRGRRCLRGDRNRNKNRNSVTSAHRRALIQGQYSLGTSCTALRDYESCGERELSTCGVGQGLLKAGPPEHGAYKAVVTEKISAGVSISAGTRRWRWGSLAVRARTRRHAMAAVMGCSPGWGGAVVLRNGGSQANGTRGCCRLSGSLDRRVLLPPSGSGMGGIGFTP